MIFKWSYRIDQHTSFLTCMDSHRDAWPTFAMFMSLYTYLRKIALGSFCSVCTNLYWKSCFSTLMSSFSFLIVFFYFFLLVIVFFYFFDFPPRLCLLLFPPRLCLLPRLLYHLRLRHHRRWRLNGHRRTVGWNDMKSTHSFQRYKPLFHELGREWVSERANEWAQRSANEWAVRAKERADERMAQYSTRRFHIHSTHSATF